MSRLAVNRIPDQRRSRRQTDPKRKEGSHRLEDQRWYRIQNLFLGILELDEKGQAAALAEATPDLREEIQSMLAAHRSWDGTGEFSLSSSDQKEPLLGQQLDRYRILELLGRGGMGDVYLAERADQQFQQRVALKIIQRGLSGTEAERRFRLERQILARLAHPGIARLLDGGITESGLPYLVLEYVDGQPITEALDRGRLSIDKRLELFESVCRAVHYAHRNLVVHRDLKPSNILVTSEHEFRLLDFGIAKLLEPEGLDAGLDAMAAETGTAIRVFTPNYASPEQVRGEVVTTATDVYSLGLLLFELLTGVLHRRTQGLNHFEIARLIEDSSPRKPSDVVFNAEDSSDDASPEARAASRGHRPETLRRSLLGDLDTIVNACTHFDPARRYPSAEQLADDVRRYLEGRPITARKDSFTYRTRKFVQRHPLGAVVTASILLLILSFSLLSVRQARALERQRDLARIERDRAQEVTAFVVDLFESNPFAWDDTARDTLTVREFLQQSEGHVEESLQSQPATRAALLELLGRFHGSLGSLEKAEKLAAAAVDLHLELGTGSDLETAGAMDTLATIYQHRGEYDRAENLFRRSLAIQESQFVDGPELAVSLNNLSALLDSRGQKSDSAEMESLDLRALAIRQRYFGKDHLEVAQSLNNLAVFYAGLDSPASLDQAEQYYRRALEIRQHQLGPLHPSVANTANNLAALLRDRGDYSAAEPLFRDAIRGWSESLGPEHPKVAVGYYGLYLLQLERGDLQGAEDALRQCVAINRQSLPKGHPYVVDGALALGKLLLVREQPSLAEPYLGEALALSRQTPDDPNQIIEALQALARVSEVLERPEEGMELVNEVQVYLDSVPDSVPENQTAALADARSENLRLRALFDLEISAVSSSKPEPSAGTP